MSISYACITRMDHNKPRLRPSNTAETVMLKPPVTVATSTEKFEYVDSPHSISRRRAFTSTRAAGSTSSGNVSNTILQSERQVSPGKQRKKSEDKIILFT
jgi:hypothetical protein